MSAMFAYCCILCNKLSTILAFVSHNSLFLRNCYCHIIIVLVPVARCYPSADMYCSARVYRFQDRLNIEFLEVTSACSKYTEFVIVCILYTKYLFKTWAFCLNLVVCAFISESNVQNTISVIDSIVANIKPLPVNLESIIDAVQL